MTQTTALLQLQKLDTEADVATDRIRELDALLARDDAVRQQKQVVADLEGRQRAGATKQRDLELETASLDANIARISDRLYGGSVTNPKELSDLQADLASLNRRKAELEERLLEAMIQVEALGDELAAAEERLQQVVRVWAQDQEQWTREKDTLEARLEEIDGLQPDLQAQIDPAALATYQQLRRRKGGLAVAVAQGSSCSACGVAVSAGLSWKIRQGELAQCSNCERIILQP